MAIDKTIKLNIDAEDVIKKLEKIEKDLESVKTGVKDNTKQMDDLGKSAKTTAKGMTTLAGGLGTVALALKALAVSAVIKVFDIFFTLLQNNQVVLDAVNTGFEFMSILLKKVVENITKTFQDPLPKLAEFGKKLLQVVISPITNAIDGIGLLGKAIGKLFAGEFKAAAGLAATGAKTMLGAFNPIDDFIKVFNLDFKELKNTIVDTVTETRNLAKSIVDLRNQIILNEAEQRKIQLTTLKDAEAQRQIRDDVSRNIEDRIEANKKLGDILKAGLGEEMKLADEKLRLAKLEASTDEKNIEKKAAVKQAEADILEIKERINGQTSEQLVNETALNDERIANLQELSDIGKSEYDRQINDIKVQAAQKRQLALRTIKDEKKLQETLVKIDEDAAKQKAEIERALGQQRRDIVSNTLGSISNLIGKESAAGKALSVAQALINTYSAAAAALAPPPVGAGPIFGPIAAAGAVASGLKTVKDIMSVALPEGDMGMGSAPSVSPSSGGGSIGSDIIPTPSLGGIGGASLIPNIGGIGSAGLGMPPVQAYVVENDISNSQALQEELEIQATL
tara:strand:- start:36 stop:1733 length:1698 start_codon:yes stop_codon:yes gene_type:complete